MTEAIFAGKEIKELSLEHRLALFASRNTIFAGLTKHFLMCDSPRYAGDWDRQNEQPDNLSL